MKPSVKRYYFTFLNDNIYRIIDELKSYKKICICLPYNIDLYLEGAFDFSTISQLQHMGISVSFIRTGLENDSGKFCMISEEKYQEEFTVQDFIQHVLNGLEKRSIEDIIETVLNSKNLTITPANIPQFSNFKDGTYNLIGILRKSGDFGPSFVELGKYLTGPGKNDIAYTKYGENHAKLASLLDLSWIFKHDRNRVFLTDFGKEVSRLEIEVFDDIITKLLVRIPVIKYILKTAVEQEVIVDEIITKHLAKSTVKRRKSNINKILKMLEDRCRNDCKDVFTKIR